MLFWNPWSYDKLVLERDLRKDLACDNDNDDYSALLACSLTTLNAEFFSMFDRSTSIFLCLLCLLFMLAVWTESFIGIVRVTLGMLLLLLTFCFQFNRNSLFSL